MKHTPRRVWVASSLLALTVAPLTAQNSLSQDRAEQLRIEEYLRTKDRHSLQEDELRRQAEWLQSDLVRKANKFALLWVQFTAEENTKHTFDVKLARKLEKAFSELQKSPGWPSK